MNLEVETMLADWDKGETIWSVEMGGLGPGYEQAIQVCAVEFARACKDLQGMKNDDPESTRIFREACDKRLHEIDEQLGGMSGAQVSVSQWLAWQWCFAGGPAALQKRYRQKGGEDRCIQVSNYWPKVEL